MPIFVYKGYDLSTGAPKKGKLQADSLKAARQILRSKEKVIPAELKEELAVNAKGSGFRLGATTTSASIYAAGKSSKKGRKTIFPKTLYFFARFLKLVT